MDDKRFDEISRFLGTSVSRQGVFKLLAGFGAAGASALGGLELIDAKKRKNKDKVRDGGANAEGKKKKGKKKKGKNKKKSQQGLLSEANNCPQNKKKAVCHCPNGQGGENCNIICVGEGYGHLNDEYDCMCAGEICKKNENGERKCIPQCGPGVCPSDLRDDATCGAPTTCTGSCDKDSDCPDLDNCVCNKQSGGDRSHEDKGTCGAPVCGGFCKKTEDCRGLDNCVCNKKQGDRSNDWGYCGPPQTCAGECWSSDDCPKVDNCVCTKNGKTSGGSKGTCVTPNTTTTPEQTTTTPEQTTTTPQICGGKCASADARVISLCPPLEGCLCDAASNDCVTCPKDQQCGQYCCPENEVCTDPQSGTCSPVTTTTPEQTTTTTPEQTTTTPEQTTTTPEQTTTTPQQTTTTPFVPGCIPEKFEVACAGLACGPASDGCGNDYECGTCGRKKSKKKGRRGQQQICVSGVCKATGKKRCVGSGLAGQPCGGKKCKCAGGRRCNNGKCCEPVGDGSVHCTANSDCCPGLMCARRRPGQHKVCMRKNAKSEGELGEPTETSTPGLAIGALLTGLALKGGERWFGSAGTNAPIALDELGNQSGQREV